MDQGKAVDVEVLKQDLKQSPFSQERFWFLLKGLHQGAPDTHGVVKEVIAPIESQLTLKNICFQFLHANPQHLNHKDLRAAACGSADADEFVKEAGPLAKQMIAVQHKVPNIIE
jgi:hypothetical protein